ncbi:hypothetical protein UNDYM_1267 [Undibacterium sp. YM2]|uniref:Nmad2 family putative nucleotide modification protein n=1 Tax=Undibacterium sp. YM2 TaxID=2058625 RepID=UPI001331D76F|nr:hypothetical protein [Undibacterium sp. YM2]BBB65520.1 hypothetical protein UNDYM_1267 [Undibacterium sp. YM2]
MAQIYSYVVRYDSGFAPNPFYSYCTLATCKPDIRRSANVGDWIVGCGSNARGVRRGGHLVYAMRVTETMTFDAYSIDPRFRAKQPYRTGSRKQSCGDNIYFREKIDAEWQQRDSFHSSQNGTINGLHVRRDTGVNRVLVSDDFVYFGGTGPKFPLHLRDNYGRALCKSGIGRSCFNDPKLLGDFELWLSSLLASGYQGPPYEWISLRDE